MLVFTDDSKNPFFVGSEFWIPSVSHASLFFLYSLERHFFFYKLLAACCQGYELGERLDTVEKAGVVEVGEDVRETGDGIGLGVDVRVGE